MKLLVLLFGLALGTAAAIKTVSLMNAATAVVDQSLEGSRP